MSATLGTWAAPEGKRDVSVGLALQAVLNALDEGTTTHAATPSTEYYSFRYNFRPESIDSSKPARIDEVDPQPRSDGSKSFKMNPSSAQGEDRHTFLGLQQPAKDFECVLIFDEATGSFTLEKLDSIMALTHSKGNHANGTGRQHSPVPEFEESPASVATVTADSTSPPQTLNKDHVMNGLQDVEMGQVIDVPAPKPVKKPPPPKPAKAPITAAASKTKTKRPREEDAIGFAPRPKRPTPPPPAPAPLMLPPKRAPSPPRARQPSPPAFQPKSDLVFSDDEDFEDIAAPQEKNAPTALSESALTLTVEEYEPDDFPANDSRNIQDEYESSEAGEVEMEVEGDDGDGDDLFDGLEENNGDGDGDGDGDDDDDGEAEDDDEDEDDFGLGKHLEQAFNHAPSAPGQGQLAGKAPMDMSAFAADDDDDDTDSSEEDSD